MTTLKLKKWPEYRNYSIITEGLKIEFKTNESYNQQIIKFEDIGFEEQLTQFRPSPTTSGLFISVFFNILLLLILFIDNFKTLNSSNIIGLISGIVAGMSAWSRHLFKFEKVKFIKGNVTLSFWYFKKHQELVDRFIESLKGAKKDYFRNKYLRIDDYEDLTLTKQKFQWLKSQDYITEPELKDWISQVDNRKVIRGF